MNINSLHPKSPQYLFVMEETNTSQWGGGDETLQNKP